MHVTNSAASGGLLRQLRRFYEALAVLKAVTPNVYTEFSAIKIELLAAGIAGLSTL